MRGSSLGLISSNSYLATVDEQATTSPTSIPRKGDIIELTIEDWGDHGRGIGRAGRMVVLTDRGLPGDQISARIVKRRSHHLEAKLESILVPSAHRVEPRCAHFGVCGGCRLQDLDYARQVADKVRHVADQLQRIGGLQSLPEIEAISCDPPYGYRNKMEFSFGGARAQKISLGLHAQNNYSDSFDLNECWITDARAGEIVRTVREFFSSGALAAYDPVAHTGYLRFLVVRFGVHTGDVLVNLVTADGPWPAAVEFGEHLRQKCPFVTTALWTVNKTRANVAFGEVDRVFFGPGVLHEQLGPFTFEIAPTGFFQTNTRNAEKLFGKVVEWIAGTGERVLDLYSGAGAISLFLSQAAAEVTGVEVHADSVAAAIRNAERNGVTNCRFVCADTLDHLRALPPEEIRSSCIVLDPPRAGLHPKIVKLLLQSKSARIVYVSCNPAALARDLAVLQEGYGLTRMAAVDMFPHTPHVEAVALLEAM